MKEILSLNGKNGDTTLFKLKVVKEPGEYVISIIPTRNAKYKDPKKVIGKVRTALLDLYTEK